MKLQILLFGVSFLGILSYAMGYRHSVVRNTEQDSGSGRFTRAAHGYDGHHHGHGHHHGGGHPHIHLGGGSPHIHLGQDISKNNKNFD
ncbi:unnamed protein product [Allacma fusca]|uniref:Uncharacterized protein n=1 Tax=Allacma fusca TaxID=39272 RepID=A0A8J2JIT9_9HEXA|nr:unnamed protein product [Allacma fusca]